MTIKCPICGKQNKNNSKFCSRCGEILSYKKFEDNGQRYCPKCGTSLLSTAKFCSNCGHEFKNLDNSKTLNNKVNNSLKFLYKFDESIQNYRLGKLRFAIFVELLFLIFFEIATCLMRPSDLFGTLGAFLFFFFIVVLITVAISYALRKIIEFIDNHRN